MAGRGNPVLDVINSMSRPIEGIGAAARTGAMAGQSFEKGASLALKLDMMLREDEARRQNQMLKSQELIQNTVKMQIDANYKDNMLDLNRQQFNALEKQRGFTNALNLANAEDTNYWKGETLKETKFKNRNPVASKNLFKNISDAYDKTVKRHTTKNMFDEEVIDQAGVQQDPIYGMVAGYMNGQVPGQPPEQLPSQTMPQPAPGPTTANAARGTLATVATPSVAPTNLGTGLSTQYNFIKQRKNDIESGLELGTPKVVDGIYKTFSSNPSLLATPEGSEVYTKGILSNNKDTRRKFGAIYNNLGSAQQQIVSSYVKPVAYSRAILDISDPNERFKTPFISTNSQLGTDIKNTMYAVNNAYRAESGTIVDMLENNDVVTGFFSGAMATIGIGKDSSTKAALLADRMSRNDHTWSKETGLFPNAVSSIWLSKTANTFWTDKKSYHYGWGITGTNVKDFATPWRQGVIKYDVDSVGNQAPKQTTLSDYMLPNGIAVKVKSSNQNMTKKSDNQIFREYQQALKDMQKNYSKEELQKLNTNIASITQVLTKVVENKSFVKGDKMNLNADDNTLVKVNLYNNRTNKMEVVEAAPVQLALMVQAMLQGGLRNSFQ